MVMERARNRIQNNTMLGLGDAARVSRQLRVNRPPPSVLDFCGEADSLRARESCRTRRRMPVRRGHAHWQPGRYFATRAAHLEGVRRDCLRRHAPDREIAFAFRYSE